MNFDEEVDEVKVVEGLGLASSFVADGLLVVLVLVGANEMDGTIISLGRKKEDGAMEVATNRERCVS